MGVRPPVGGGDLVTTLRTWNDGSSTIVVDPDEIVGMTDRRAPGGFYYTTINLRGGGSIECAGSVCMVIQRLKLKTIRADH